MKILPQTPEEIQIPKVFLKLCPNVGPDLQNRITAFYLSYKKNIRQAALIGSLIGFGLGLSTGLALGVVLGSQAARSK